MAILLDGKDTAQKFKKVLEASVNSFTKGFGFAPRLAVIRVGDDPASEVYIKQKEKACAEIGILSTVIHLEDRGTEVIDELYDIIYDLNLDESVDAIMLQLPLPESIRYATNRIVNYISPDKDVDCLTERNMGRLLLAKRNDGTLLEPCTPAGITLLAASYQIPIKRSHCVIVGRSNMVAKPLAAMLLQEDATVTVCHSQTRNLSAYTRNADVLIVAAGNKHLITPSMVEPGVAVFDVGITRENGKLYGDVHPDVMAVASHMTPVPGGVGPMTVAMLLQNTLTLARRNVNK